jgi:hypothetical protein
MKTTATVKCLLVLAAAVLAPGCATHNVNPSQARAHTGYVDFHARPPGDLCWEVSSLETRGQSYRRVFSELKPPEGGFLRLAFAPGRHRLRITFLNRVIAEPAEMEVEVQDGKITPVRVTLTEAGSASVRTKDIDWGATSKGLYGRTVKVGSEEAVCYELSVGAEAPIGYQTKGQLPNAR